MGRHTLLGVGITLIIFSLGLIVFDLPATPQPEKPKETVQISKQEIINRAQKLGMNFPAVNYSQGIDLEAGVNLTETIEKLPIKEKKQAQPKDKKAASSNSSIDQKNKNETKKKEKVELTITRGMKGWEVADLLVDKGLLEERAEFIKLLEKFNIESKIMAGKYEFDAEASKLEVLLTVTAD